MSDDKKVVVNPKDAIGVTKVPWSTIPLQVLGELGLAMLEGALKYGRHNYRKAGVKFTVYFDACVARHLAAFMEGEDIDPASGLSHITKAIAGLVVLRDCMLQENWIDDRPPKVKNQNWIDDLNQKTKNLLEKYPDSKLPFTQKGIEIDAVMKDYFKDTEVILPKPEKVVAEGKQNQFTLDGWIECWDCDETFPHDGEEYGKTCEDGYWYCWNCIYDNNNKE